MIGPSITIRGNVSGDEDLTVEGRIEGNVRLSKSLTVAPEAEIVAEIEAQTVTVGGRIAGEITANERLAVENGAVVIGDVSTPRLVIEDGAQFKGRVTMRVDIPELKRADTRRR